MDSVDGSPPGRSYAAADGAGGAPCTIAPICRRLLKRLLSRPLELRFIRKKAGQRRAGNPPVKSETYLHGHDESVLRSHRWRTAENSCGYLLDRLKPGLRILDVGCGPGTITVDLARRVEPGRVVGLDRSEAVLSAAREAAAAAGVKNVEFRTGDVYSIEMPAGSFDIVHAHQVLQHLSDPVAALREMARVCRPDGTIAVRDGDYAGIIWFPLVEGLDDWLDLYHRAARANRGEPNAGRRLLSWARAAGLRDVRASASVWCFADEAARAWWGGLWADRILDSDLAVQAEREGLATRGELEEMSRAWRTWSAAADGWFIVPHGEILAHPG